MTELHTAEEIVAAIKAYAASTTGSTRRAGLCSIRDTAAEKLAGSDMPLRRFFVNPERLAQMLSPTGRRQVTDFIYQARISEQQAQVMLDEYRTAYPQMQQYRDMLVLNLSAAEARVFDMQEGVGTCEYTQECRPAPYFPILPFDRQDISMDMEAAWGTFRDLTQKYPFRVTPLAKAIAPLTTADVMLAPLHASVEKDERTVKVSIVKGRRAGVSKLRYCYGYPLGTLKGDE